MAFNRRYIAKKPCKFPDCDNMPKIGCGGYCWKHEGEDPGFERKEAKAILKKEQPKVKLLSLSIIDDKLVPNTAATEFQLLQNWFADGIMELAKKPLCENCGLKIPFIYFRASQAHLLPKRKEYGFPSVACHPLNRLFLGTNCGCHSKYDSTWEQASQMKIWAKVVVNFKEIYPFIHPSEIKNLPDILRTEMK